MEVIQTDNDADFPAVVDQRHPHMVPRSERGTDDRRASLNVSDVL